MHSQENRGPSGLVRSGVAFWLGLAAIALGCSPGAEAEKSFEKKLVTVEVLTVEPELLRDTVQFGGQLGSAKSVMLKSEIEGVIASIDFQEGQRVSEGDILIRLRSSEQAARLKEALANLALAASESRRAELLLSRNASAQSHRDQAEAQLGVAQARVELARVALARTKIRAPFDGVVGVRMIDPGDFVTEKDTLVQIDDLDRLQASFAMGEIALPFAHVGIPVVVLVAPYPGERFPGEVFFVSPTLDTAARRILVKAWVPNDHGKLAPGLYANIEVEIARRENAILLPESAVVADRQGTFVWRIDAEQLASRVPVDLGLRKHGRVEVTRGLRAGDRVVIAGTHKVSEGKKVASVVAPSSGQASRSPEGEPIGEGT